MLKKLTPIATTARSLYQGIYQSAQTRLPNNYAFEKSMSSESNSPRYARQADILPLWRCLTLSRNAQGQDEAFAIGPDGYVWSYLTSSVGHTTGRLISTGLEASGFATAKLANNRKLVIGMQGANFLCVTETGQAQPRWSAPVKVNFDGLRGARSISQVHALERGDEVLIGVLVHYARGGKLGMSQFWVGK